LAGGRREAAHAPAIIGVIEEVASLALTGREECGLWLGNLWD